MKFLCCITLCFLISCMQRQDPEVLLSKTNIHIPTKYKILESKDDWAIGETTESYRLIISSTDYTRIVKEIKAKSFFQYLDTSKIPLYALDNNTDVKKINEVACWYDNKYYYQIFRPNPGVLITINLEKDSIMNIYYNDL